jgi:DNA-binding response OmpR family regulator
MRVKYPTPAIVLIEKDEVTLELYQRELSKSFKVFGFTELEDVLATIQDQPIQAIIIEPEICSGKGWDLIPTLQQTFSDRPIPIIVCSTRELRDSCKNLEVEKYLTKPVLPKTLKEKTLQVLKEHNRTPKT